MPLLSLGQNIAGGSGGGVSVVTVRQEVPAYTNIGVVRLANVALQRVGISQAIAALDEPSTEARVIRQVWDHVRDLVLTQAPWRFATRHAALVATTDTIAPWSHIYALPADCLRPLGIVTDSHVQARQQRIGFAVSLGLAGPVLATEVPDAVLKYTARAIAPEQWPVWFGELIAWRLAVEIANPLTKNPGIASMVTGLWQNALREAMASDALTEQAPWVVAGAPSHFERSRGAIAVDTLWTRRDD